MIDASLESEDPWMQGMSRQRLELGPARVNFEASGSGLRASGSAARENSRLSPDPVEVGYPHSEYFLPFAQGGFRTPSGKAELYCEALISQGLDPVASFTPPEESRHGKNGHGFPLELLARKADNFLNTTFTNIPAVQEMESFGLLEISGPDARSRGISEGDRVRVFNGRGEILLKARVDGKVRPGVVSAKLNWAKMTPGFQSINSLTSEKLTDMGNSATFYSVLVEVEKVSGQ
jgi:anaerobic selenocysteine-containing dehydrogenase